MARSVPRGRATFRGALAAVLGLLAALAGVVRAMPPEPRMPYDAAQAFREMWDPELLERENDPPRRTLLLTSATTWEFNPRGAYARQEPGERVLFDIKSPGVLTRFTSPGARGTYRFYVDGDPAPTWECEGWRLFLPGRSPVMPEFIARSGHGGTIHAPILFSRSLRVTAIDGAGDRWLAVVSAFSEDQQVLPWTPMSDEPGPAFHAALEQARRAWRGEPPPPRDPVVARVKPGDAWTADRDVIVTAIIGSSRKGTVALPTHDGARHVPARALFRGGRWGERFEVPFLVAKGESIAPREGGVIAIHGRDADARTARSAPRLLIVDDDGLGEFADWRRPRVTGVGRVLRMHASCATDAADTAFNWALDPDFLHEGFMLPGLLDLAGGAPHEDADSTTGTLSVELEPGEQDTLNLWCDFQTTGIPFARSVAGILRAPSPAGPMNVLWVGQVFPGPPAEEDLACRAVGDFDGTITFLRDTLDAGLPRPVQFQGNGDPHGRIQPLTDAEQEVLYRFKRAAQPPQPHTPGPVAVLWTNGGGDPEMRAEDDGSVVLELPQGFVPLPGDALWLKLGEGTPAMVLTATFEPHSGNEGTPVFPEFLARRRGKNGEVRTPARDIAAGGELMLPLGQNASWPGGRRDRVVLRAAAAGRPVALSLELATLERAQPLPESPYARWVPLLWDARERVFGMYPEAQVELRGQALYDALNPRVCMPSTQLYPEWVPQLRLEHIAAAPFGPRVALPADPGPQPDNEQAIVFAASRAGESAVLRHPALNGATALAIRFGATPDGARVTLRDAALRPIACEDLFLNERRLPARILVVNLPEPNPGDFITFEVQGPAPASHGCTVIVERVLVGGPPSLRHAQSTAPRKPSRVLNPEPPRRPF